VKRTIVLAGIGALVLVGGVAVAASHPSDPPVLARAQEPETTTSSAPPLTLPPTTGTTFTIAPEVTALTVPETATTEPPAPAPDAETTIPPDTAVPPATTVPPETTTSTTAVRQGQYAIHLECGDGADGIVCEWGDLPAGTAQQVMMRETQGPSQELDRTDDVTVHRYVDDTAEPGVSYAYRVSAFSADGRFLGTSNPVRLAHADAGGSTDS
jgi:hypothetical protein